MLDIESIYSRWYEQGSPLLALLSTHSGLVARKALECADRHNLDIDRDFVYEAAMLHDIGIVRCDAPDILCEGAEPYICHGIIGSEMLDSIGLPRHALVCERHTGAGLTVQDIIDQNLPLPHRDMTPQTTEEKLICYADKFFSKSGDYKTEKPLNRVINSMKRHGDDTLRRFMELNSLFG